MGLEPNAAARLRLVQATTRDPRLRAELAELLPPPATPSREGTREGTRASTEPRGRAVREHDRLTPAPRRGVRRIER